MSADVQPTLVGEQLGLTGLPDAPQPRPGTVRAAVGRTSSAAGRPLHLVRPEPHPPADPGPLQVVRRLHIIAPPTFNATPSARSWCRCGYDRTGKGRSGVLALVEAHNAHPEHCPLLNLEGNKAA
ncbi:hypothetical protein [Streptomyces sp. NBC_01104]|uniref:hypothetical protein n=1 Tax=Streptomyces sp. NBC_01104 TaxID=2903750 RepID=UPI00386B52B9|nr:hypothetical protein OG450_12490 [Streptomyces sp. NBC_01104]